MPRIARVDVGDEIYHVLNRANARAQIFDTAADYIQFESILEEAIEKFNMRLLAYYVMPNHWHLVVYPRQDGDLQRFMSLLTNTNTRRWHVERKTVGQGHLYQGRYKSFLCENNQHLLTLLRYVERNASAANLVPQSELWRWSSVWRREKGILNQRKYLTAWPIDIPNTYLSLPNTPLSVTEEEKLLRSEERSIPFCSDLWVDSIVKKYGIEQVMRPLGRPKKGD